MYNIHNLSEKAPARWKTTRHVLLALFAVSFLLLIFPVLGRSEAVRKSNLVRNGGFSKRGAIPSRFTQENVEKLRQEGWKCPDVSDWPQWWGVRGKGTVEFPRAGGVQADGYAKIGGQGVFLTGYHGLPLEDCNYVYTIWARGKGKLRFRVLSYGKDEKGNARFMTKPGEAAAGKSVQVDSKEWVRYRHLLVKTPALWNVHPWVGEEEGGLDIDDVDIVPSTPALDLIVAAEEGLYGTGALIENMDIVGADDTFAEKVKLYQEAVAVFRQAKNTLDKDLAAAMEKEINSLAPYVLTANISAVRAPYYNEMIALTRVLNKLIGKGAMAPGVTRPKGVLIVEVDHKPGMRKLKKARQKNLWVNSGSGSSPIVRNSAIFRTS